ncbi:MAG: peptidyl-prolyl cis-trans isomerase [Sterolibacteriaceae bacterium]|nr:peptidyl-prolyl cis-trans isomerase [Sterolibacteriaceae bacterium]
MRVFSVLFGLSYLVCSPPAVGADQALTDGRTSLTVKELKSELLALSAEVRERIVADKATLTRFAASLMQDRRVADSARGVGLAELPAIRAAAERTLRDLLVSRYMSDEVARLSAKAPDFRILAKERFEANRSDFMRSEAVRVAHILIRVDVEDEHVSEAEQRAKAEDVLGKLKAGADFAALAKDLSEDKGSAARGGEIPGWIERDKTVPPFEKAAFALKPGELSRVIRTCYGFHIIKLLEYRKAEPQTFSEVAEQLIAKARTDYQSELRREIAQKFAGTRPVEINDAMFDAVNSK